METPHLVVHNRRDRELGLFLRQSVARNDLVLEFHRASSFSRDLRAFPVDHGEFVRTPSDIHCLIQHCCLPSTFIDWGNLALRALRDLHASEEITLNYNTIYAVLPNSFACRCGTPGCYGVISGFRALSTQQKLELELHLSPYLHRLLNDEMLARQRLAS